MPNAQAQPLTGTDEAARNAYNAAFSELELGWFWDADTYRTLLAQGEPRECVGSYMRAERPHLLRAYDADCLTSAIEAVRARFGRC